MTIAYCLFFMIGSQFMSFYLSTAALGCDFVECSSNYISSSVSSKIWVRANLLEPVWRRANLPKNACLRLPKFAIILPKCLYKYAQMQQNFA